MATEDRDPQQEPPPLPSEGTKDIDSTAQQPPPPPQHSSSSTTSPPGANNTQDAQPPQQPPQPQQDPSPNPPQPPPPNPDAAPTTTTPPSPPLPNNRRAPPPPPPAPATTTATTTTTTATPTPTPMPMPPPGPRAQRFQEMFDLALTHTLARISPDNFAACYPTVARRAPHVLRQVQRGLVDRLAQLCRHEFAAVLARRHVVARLNELEGLVADAEQRRRWEQRSNKKKAATAAGKKREGANNNNNNNEGPPDVEDDNFAAAAAEPPNPTPPHLLPAHAVLAAHLAPHLTNQQSQMNARLQNTQAANATLWAAVQAQRREVEGLLGALEAVLRDVDGAAALMDGVPAEELARESLTVEAEMADVTQNVEAFCAFGVRAV